MTGRAAPLLSPVARMGRSHLSRFPGAEPVSLPAVQVTQSPVEKFREYLGSRPNPQRFTGQQRDLVEHVFSRHSRFDADQLMRDLDGAGLNVSRATVYRTLTKL